MNKKLFYDTIRTSLFGGRLTQKQVEGIDFKLEAWNNSGLQDIRWLAYMLATSYHETAKTMQPVAEYGKGKGKRYGKKIKHDGSAYVFPDEIYYGRGDVQLTWYENYDEMGRLISLPLLENPDLALIPEVSAIIMIEGMTKGKSGKGDFTGVSLENFFNDSKDDPLNARKIINGLDKAALIAGYHNKFLEAIKKSK